MKILEFAFKEKYKQKKRNLSAGPPVAVACGRGRKVKSVRASEATKMEASE